MSYYGCTSTRHTEHTCLSYRTFNKKFTYRQWCDNCKGLFPEQGGSNE